MDGVIRKYNPTLSSLLQYACPKQNVNIAVNRADVAFRPTSYLANGHRSGGQPSNLRMAQRYRASASSKEDLQRRMKCAHLVSSRGTPAEARRWVSTREATPIVTDVHFRFLRLFHRRPRNPLRMRDSSK